MTEIFRPPYMQVETSAGVPVSGAKLHFYQAGTTTDITTYQDSGKVTPHANPVVADASGRFAAIYVDEATYKCVLKDASDVTLQTFDNIGSTTSGNEFADNVFRVTGNLDTTKKVAFQVDGLATATTRTLTVPDKDGTLALTSEVVGSNEQSMTPINLGLAASVGSNAITIALKGADGNDPSAANPVYIPFRNVTAATGTPSVLTVEAATSLVISSGSTLGMTSGVAATLAIVAFNDGGTLRLGLTNPLVRPLNDGIASSTAEGGASAADSAGVIYTSTAVTSKAMTVLGYATVTEAAAGTWDTAPATLKVAGGPEFNDVVPIITPWVAYTPTFTAAGTVSSVSIFSRRKADTLEIMGTVVWGAPSASEARMTLGFNGTDGGITSDTTKVPSIRHCGTLVRGASHASFYWCLIESNVAYMTFSRGDGSNSHLTKMTGSQINSGETVSINASIPISGW